MSIAEAKTDPDLANRDLPSDMPLAGRATAVGPERRTHLVAALRVLDTLAIFMTSECWGTHGDTDGMRIRSGHVPI